MKKAIFGTLLSVILGAVIYAVAKKENKKSRRFRY